MLDWKTSPKISSPDASANSFQNLDLIEPKVVAPTVIKILILGDKGVGKTHIARSFLNNARKDEYTKQTLLHISRTIRIGSEYYVFQLWEAMVTNDMAYRDIKIALSLYKFVDIYILVYALDNLATFHNLNRWITELMNVENVQRNGFPFIVVGNKEDVPPSKKEISRTKVENWCWENNCWHVETSVTKYASIKQLFRIVFHLWKHQKVALNNRGLLYERYPDEASCLDKQPVSNNFLEFCRKILAICVRYIRSFICKEQHY